MTWCRTGCTKGEINGNLLTATSTISIVNNRPLMQIVFIQYMQPYLYIYWCLFLTKGRLYRSHVFEASAIVCSLHTWRVNPVWYRSETNGSSAIRNAKPFVFRNSSNKIWISVLVINTISWRQPLETTSSNWWQKHLKLGKPENYGCQLSLELKLVVELIQRSMQNFSCLCFLWTVSHSQKLFRMPGWVKHDIQFGDCHACLFLPHWAVINCVNVVTIQQEGTALNKLSVLYRWVEADTGFYVVLHSPLL